MVLKYLNDYKEKMSKPEKTKKKYTKKQTTEVGSIKGPNKPNAAPISPTKKSVMTGSVNVNLLMNKISKETDKKENEQTQNIPNANQNTNTNLNNNNNIKKERLQRRKTSFKRAFKI